MVHQYPSDSVIGTTSSQETTQINFSEISSYVIPPYELCNRPLSICANGHKVLGFPVSLEDAKYERNRFTFNVCFVLKAGEDSELWAKVVSKTACFFKAIEEEDGLLQAEERLAHLKWAGEDGYPAQDVGVVYTLLEAVMEDLNTYGEACVRIDDLHILNLAITQSKAAPAKVTAWDVPLLIRPLPTIDGWTWDLTLQRIHQYIDGVNHISRIAELADVELKLVKKAVRELLYHDRAMLLDTFHFQAIYTLTSEFACFVRDETMQDECAAYIAQEDRGTHASKSIQDVPAQSPATSARQIVIGLYQDLHSAICLRDFYLRHEALLADNDIRRLITYGVIKGFLRRIHKYALAIASHQTPPRLSISNGFKVKAAEDAEREWDRAWKKAAFSSGWATPPTEPPPDSIIKVTQNTDDIDVDSDEDDRLRRYLDGNQCMDEICVTLRTSEKKVVDRLRSGRFGEVVFFCK